MMLLRILLAISSIGHGAAGHVSSGPNLLTKLQHEHPDGAMSTAHQTYLNAGNHRLLQAAGGGTLTTENTRPIAIHLDFKSLEEATAPKYTACFTEGAWFKRGFPTPPVPPSSGAGNCDRTSGAVQDCWGKCLASDVITAEKRDLVKTLVTKIVTEEVTPLLRVQPVVGNLKFERNMGVHQRAVISKGYEPYEGCAVDCTVLSGVAVSDDYCTNGVADVDAVLSLTMPPPYPGVGGTGTYCASDQNRRPLWLVFEWMRDISDLTSLSLDQQVARVRGLIVHEVFHTLGFSNTMFRYARDGSGNRKNLIELKSVTDTDGSKDDVWHFTKGRAYELAQTYFDCTGGNTSWLGLPLMGAPEMGRGSHWETRILRDDVMSYGHTDDAVSPITLASMEDLGHYLADYALAGCMSWGFKQGCGFVTSRCGSGNHDRTASASSSSDCRGNSLWQSVVDPYLESKCATGLKPCDGANSGYLAGSGTCDAQCFTAWADGQRADCKAAPTAAVESASLEGVLDNLKSLDQNSWQVWTALASWVFFVLLLLMYALQCVCPRAVCKWCPHGTLPGQCLCPMRPVSKKIVYVISGFEFLVGLAICGVALYSIFIYGEVALAFVSRRTMWITAGVSGTWALLSLFVLIATCCEWLYPLYPLSWVLFFFSFVQVSCALLIVYWVYSLDGINYDLMAEAVGQTAQMQAANLITDALATPISVLEGFTCTAYVRCCKDPALDAPGGRGTCAKPHEGMATDAMDALLDASSPNFCAYITGAPTKTLIPPPAAVCMMIDQTIAGFDQAQCQANFCAAGVDGHITFVTQIIAGIKRFSIPIGAAIATMVVLQVIYACNVRSARFDIKDKKRRWKDYQSSGTANPKLAQPVQGGGGNAALARARAANEKKMKGGDVPGKGGRRRFSSIMGT